MKNKLLKVACIMLVICFALSGCSTSLKEENAALSKELTALKEENANLENTISELDSKIQEQQAVPEESTEPAFGNSGNIYPLYTADINTYEMKKGAYIYLPKEASLKQKLDMLASALSEAYFSNLPIEVIKIEDKGNKKIAVVNLKEAPENIGKTDPKDTTGKTWAFQYMQGSTGGTVTQTRLIETMLQKDYQGQWIDGVRFLYNGGVCDYEHAPLLKGISYRE